MESFIEREFRFQSHVAKEVGVNGAIMLTHFKGWIMYNMDHNNNFKDGEYWTYSSKKGLTNTFPFWSERQIRTILDKLIEGGYIKTGNYNKVGYDRTLWYTLTTKGWALFSTTYMPEWTVNIGQKSPMEKTEKSNQLDINDQPIPIININNNNNNIYTDKKKTIKEPRHKYGEFKNVLLSDKDLEKLKAEYGEELVEKYIKKMDEWIELNGRRYKNYYLALRQWMNKEVSKKQEKVEKQEGDTKYDEEYFTKLMEETLRGGNKF